MATTLTAGNATNGLSLTPDNTGILQVKTGTGAGTTALTLDASQNATLSGTLTSGAITSTGVITSSTGALYPLVSGTAVTASGTSVDFTGIPSTAKRITVMFSGVSTNGSSSYIIQLGDSGGIETTGYVSSALSGTAATSTVGFLATSVVGATNLVGGTMVLTLLGSNTWTGFGATVRSAVGQTSSNAGYKTLTDVLDRVRITTENGTDTFDAGSINILWE